MKKDINMEGYRYERGMHKEYRKHRRDIYMEAIYMKEQSNKKTSTRGDTAQRGYYTKEIYTRRG